MHQRNVIIITMKLLINYIEQIQNAKTAKAVDRVFREILINLNCNEFTYTFYSKGFNSSRILKYEYTSESLQQWHNHFIKEDYEAVDSIGQKVRSSIIPVQWDLREEYKRARATEKKMFAEALDYGLSTGISIPIYNPKGEVAILVIQSDDISDQIEKQANLPHILHQLSMFYHQKITDLALELMPENPVDLTLREKQCLQLTAHNKNVQEISEILKITARTVGFHIENANRKLQTRNKYQSIMKALSLGLLEL